MDDDGCFQCYVLTTDVQSSPYISGCSVKWLLLKDVAHWITVGNLSKVDLVKTLALSTIL